MNDLQSLIKTDQKRKSACRRPHGRRMVRAAMRVLVLGLAIWPVWNWVAAPLLALPTLSYWQTAAIVAFIAFTSSMFSKLSDHRHRFRTGSACMDGAWSCSGGTNAAGQG